MARAAETTEGARIDWQEWIGRVYQGDCLDLMASLPGESIDLVLTDPPYGLNYNNGDLASVWEEALGHGPAGPARPIAGDGRDDWVQNLPLWMEQFARVLVKGGCCCCCCCGGGPSPIFAEMTLAMDAAMQFKQAIVWDKGGLGMGWHYRRSYEFMLVAQKPGAACKWYGDNRQSNVVRIPKIIPSAVQHPTEKPVRLMEQFILLHSRPGDLILEPFAGSGSTLEAAERLGRRWIAAEIDPMWAEKAQTRAERARLSRPLPLLSAASGTRTGRGGNGEATGSLW